MAAAETSPHVFAKYQLKADEPTKIKTIWPSKNPGTGSARTLQFMTSIQTDNNLFKEGERNHWPDYVLVDPHHDGNCGSHVLADISSTSLYKVNQMYNSLALEKTKKAYMLSKGVFVSQFMIALYTTEVLKMGIIVIGDTTKGGQGYTKGAYFRIDFYIPAPPGRDTLVLIRCKSQRSFHFAALSASADRTTMTHEEFYTFYQRLHRKPEPLDVTMLTMQVKFEIDELTGHADGLTTKKEEWEESWEDDVPPPQKRTVVTIYPESSSSEDEEDMPPPTKKSIQDIPPPTKKSIPPPTKKPKSGTVENPATISDSEATFTDFSTMLRIF